jgi:Acetyltransferase (GNAT) domain
VNLHRIDPVADPRWETFVVGNPQASIFHTAGWLEALQKTYGYEPVVYTTAPSGQELKDGIPFCRIRTWLTARRLVSLPFSDHCAPLVPGPAALDEFLAALKQGMETDGWQYIEIRPGSIDVPTPTGFARSEAFASHTIDLRPSLPEIFRRFHKDCIQRKIQRAERERLTCEDGHSHELLDKFYGLMIRTRRRQGLPPQPVQWFRNLIACLGKKVKIRVAFKGGSPVAGILTLLHNQSLVYKYGCSDQRSNNLGGTQLLLWNAIQEAKQNQLLEFDLGRSDSDNSGLIDFKDRWGAARSELAYFRYSRRPSRSLGQSWQMNLAKRFFTHVPNPFLAAAGRLLYRHIG